MRDRAAGILMLFLIVMLVIAGFVALVTVKYLGYFTDGRWLTSWDALWRALPVLLTVGLALALLFSIWLVYGFERAYKADAGVMAAKLERESDAIKARLSDERSSLWKEQSVLSNAKRAHETSVQAVKQREINSGAEARRAADTLLRAERKLAEAKQLVAENKAKMHRLSGQINRQREKIAKLDSE